MVTVTENPIVFLLLAIAFLLLIGMVIDRIAVLIILTQILAPFDSTFGIDLVHFGVIMCLVVVIGSLTPPIGTGLFIASSVGEVKLERLIVTIMPLLLVAFIVALFITFFPQAILWIPEWVMSY
ncbi:TRAP transporter large permease subunit [Geomicrobium sp. JCM 19039]|uniref:TRAP transporter large permease subunit n=1 Tax=Geomicrobium sp. JCM 19039 TaxID=1460636 RepID=UPI000694B787